MDSQNRLVVEKLADELRAQGLRVSTAVKDGPPQEVLLQEARKLAADCIFIEPHGFQPALSLDRSLERAAVALILGAPCSVEVVRPKRLSGGSPTPAA